jgi:hypothetical protein
MHSATPDKRCYRQLAFRLDFDRHARRRQKLLLAIVLIIALVWIVFRFAR